jgi:hypothetical protein
MTKVGFTGELHSKTLVEKRKARAIHWFCLVLAFILAPGTS